MAGSEQIRLALAKRMLTSNAGSDPGAGTGPSVLTHHEILRGVSLYYLTGTFLPSVYIYAQNPNGFRLSYTKASTDAPMLFSSFAYNSAFWPRQYVETVGNLVFFRGKSAVSSSPWSLSSVVAEA